MSATQALPETNRETGAALMVWEYQVPSLVRSNTFVQEMPKGAEIMGVQRGSLTAVMYAWVNPKMPMEQRLFCGVKTNQPLPNPGEELIGVIEDGERMFLGKCGGLVLVGSFLGWGQTWHLFEVKREREPGQEG
ncbi:MAG: hypothetical protein NVS9B14_06470 [Candidatus Acidiferrum sp.]